MPIEGDKIKPAKTIINLEINTKRYRDEEFLENQSAADDSYSAYYIRKILLKLNCVSDVMVNMTELQKKLSKDKVLDLKIDIQSISHHPDTFGDGVLRAITLGFYPQTINRKIKYILKTMPENVIASTQSIETVDKIKFPFLIFPFDLEMVLVTQNENAMTSVFEDHLQTTLENELNICEKK